MICITSDQKKQDLVLSDLMNLQCIIIQIHEGPRKVKETRSIRRKI